MPYYKKPGNAEHFISCKDKRDHERNKKSYSIDFNAFGYPSEVNPIIEKKKKKDEKDSKTEGRDKLIAERLIKEDRQSQ